MERLNFFQKFICNDSSIQKDYGIRKTRQKYPNYKEVVPAV